MEKELTILFLIGIILVWYYKDKYFHYYTPQIKLFIGLVIGVLSTGSLISVLNQIL